MTILLEAMPKAAALDRIQRTASMQSLLDFQKFHFFSSFPALRDETRYSTQKITMPRAAKYRPRSASKAGSPSAYPPPWMNTAAERESDAFHSCGLQM